MLNKKKKQESSVHTDIDIDKRLISIEWVNDIELIRGEVRTITRYNTIVNRLFVKIFHKLHTINIDIYNYLYYNGKVNRIII